MNIDFKALEAHINEQVCPVHDAHPVALYEGEDMKLTVCCEEFRLALLAQTKNSLKELLLNRDGNSLN